MGNFNTDGLKGWWTTPTPERLAKFVRLARLGGWTVSFEEGRWRNCQSLIMTRRLYLSAGPQGDALPFWFNAEAKRVLFYHKPSILREEGLTLWGHVERGEASDGHTLYPSASAIASTRPYGPHITLEVHPEHLIATRVCGSRDAGQGQLIKTVLTQIRELCEAALQSWFEKNPRRMLRHSKTVARERFRALAEWLAIWGYQDSRSQILRVAKGLDDAVFRLLQDEVCLTRVFRVSRKLLKAGGKFHEAITQFRMIAGWGGKKRAENARKALKYGIKQMSGDNAKELFLLTAEKELIHGNKLAVLMARMAEALSPHVLGEVRGDLKSRVNEYRKDLGLPGRWEDRSPTEIANAMRKKLVDLMTGAPEMGEFGAYGSAFVGAQPKHMLRAGAHPLLGLLGNLVSSLTKEWQIDVRLGLGVADRSMLDGAGLDLYHVGLSTSGRNTELDVGQARERANRLNFTEVMAVLAVTLGMLSVLIEEGVK